MSDMKLYSGYKKLIATILYISIVISIIMTIGSVIWAILDVLMAKGKSELFLSFSLGIQIAIIGVVLAVLFFLLILFYGLFKKGVTVLLKIIFKPGELEERYRDRIGVKVIAGLLMLSLFAIIIGIVIAVFYEFILAILGGTEFTLSGVLENLSGGQIALIISVSYLLINGLAFLLIYLWFNGYGLILKMLYTLEDED